MVPWLGDHCGGLGVAVRGGVLVCVRFREVLVVALVARGRRQAVLAGGAGVAVVRWSLLGVTLDVGGLTWQCEGGRRHSAV